jgi:hypothetical protein
MRKLTWIFLFSLSAAIIPAKAAVISLGAPASAAGSFDVFVNVTGVFNPPHDTDLLLAYGFNIAFDSSVLSYLGESAGPLFTDISNNPGITAQVAGVATAILLGPGDFVEPLRLAVLHFQTKAVGTTSIKITGDTSDLNQGLIYLNGSDPISSSVSVAVTPEPSALALTGWGILAIVVTFLSRRTIGLMEISRRRSLVGQEPQ